MFSIDFLSQVLPETDVSEGFDSFGLGYMSLLSSFSAKRGVYGGRAGLDVPPSLLICRERGVYGG